PDTHFLRRDSRGWIWRGTTGGVYVADGVHLRPADWLHIDAASGLAADTTDVYGFFEDTDHSIWICGEEGVTHLKPNPSWFAPHAKPKIAAVWRDGLLVPVDALRSGLSHAQEIRIDIDRSQTAAWAGPFMRYRLHHEDPWKDVEGGAIE